MKNLIIFFALIFSMASCSNSSQKSEEVEVTVDQELKESRRALSKAANAEAAMKHVFVIKSTLSKVSREEQDKLLQEGLNVAETYKLGSIAVGFLMELIKRSTPVEREVYLAKASSALYDLGKDNPADILSTAFLADYPNSKFSDQIKNKQKRNIEDVPSELQAMAEAIFEKPTNDGIDKKKVFEYVDACEAFALGNPNHEQAPEYLYRAAQLAQSLRDYNKAMALFDWIIEYYPDHENTPSTLFLKGFVLDDELEEKEKALEIYQEFLEKYPDHKLAESAQFLIENIDKTDEELEQIIQGKKSNES